MVPLKQMMGYRKASVTRLVTFRPARFTTKSLMSRKMPSSEVRIPQEANRSERKPSLLRSLSGVKGMSMM